jgi:hypothetical protein
VIPLIHAGLGATIYILLREHFPMPWLWPLDDAVWPVAATMIVACWMGMPRRLNPLARGAIIGIVVAVALVALLGVLFAGALRYWQRHLSELPGPAMLFYGIGLAAWVFIAFLASVAVIAAGLIAGAIGEWRGFAGRLLAILLAVSGLVVPLAATWSHAVLGIGVVDLDRCHNRMDDSLSFETAILSPKIIVVGLKADCFGQLVRPETG